DNVTATITGTSSTVNTSPASAARYTVSAPGNATAGNAFDVTVTARDAYGNVATGYGGTVHLASSDPAAGLPADNTLTAGAGTFSVTLKTAGSQTVTAADTVTGSINGSSAPILTAPGATTRFAITSPSSATSGV